MELCETLRDPAQVPGKQLRTANFSPDDRIRLGEAVKKARRAAGFRSRRAFAEIAKVGKRSIDAVELFEPGVGEDVLEAIGRALGHYFDDWNEDTPRAILEDEAEPSNTPCRDARQPAEQEVDEGDPNPEDYSDLEDFLHAVIKQLLKRGASRAAIDRAVTRVVDEIERGELQTERDDPDTPRGQVS